MPRLLHPRLQASLREHFTSRCTIASKVYTVSESRQRVRTGNAPIAGMVDIPSSQAALILIRPTDKEDRTQKILSTDTQRQVKLLGFYPQIVAEQMEAIVDGVTFQIVGVEADSLSFSTRLKLEIIKP